jgi:hypothetical protein
MKNPKFPKQNSENSEEYLKFRESQMMTFGNLRKYYKRILPNTKVYLTMKYFDWEECTCTVRVSNSRIDFFDYETLVNLEILDDYLQEFYSLSENFE